MRDVKTRTAMEQPKTRQKDAIPRTAVRILQRHYAQQKQERQTQHQRQPVEYATEQAQQGAADAARLTFRATQQLQRKYVLHKYRAQKVRQRQETTAAQVRQRDMWRGTEQSATAQNTTAAEIPRTATVPRQSAQRPPAPTMTAAQQRAKQHTQHAAQRQMFQQTKAAARKAEVDNLNAQLAGAESEGMTAAAARLKAEMELDQLNTALEEGKNAAAHRGQEIAALEQQLRENTAAAAQAENARKQAEAEIETHRKELESLGASTSDVTRQREEASQKLSDNRMQKLRTEKDLSLHEAALETLKGRSGEAEARVRELQANVAAAKERIAANELRANEIKRASEENKQKITAAEETIRKANAERMEKEAAVTRLTQENRTLTDERERMSGEMARLAERKTAAETELNTTASKLWEEYQLTEAEAEKLCVPFANVADLRRQVAEVRGKIRALGNVNVGAIEEYKEVKERYDFMKAQVTDVEKSRAELNRMIAELCSEMQEMFTASFKEINRNFGAIFRELFGGGSARLYLSDENDVLNSGIEIQVSPPGKVIKNLSALSGGEQALVAISIYFAILAVNPSPFCILDEIEAALDDVNVTRYAQYLRRMTERTQFIVITHRRGTMEAADVLYGVTMQEDGVSKILRLDLENVSADLIS